MQEPEKWKLDFWPLTYILQNLHHIIFSRPVISESTDFFLSIDIQFICVLGGCIKNEILLVMSPAYKKSRKRTFLAKYSNYLLFQVILWLFCIKCARCITHNRTSTHEWPWSEFYVEKSMKNGKFPILQIFTWKRIYLHFSCKALKWAPL